MPNPVMAPVPVPILPVIYEMPVLLMAPTVENSSKLAAAPRYGTVCAAAFFGEQHKAVHTKKSNVLCVIGLKIINF